MNITISHLHNFYILFEIVHPWIALPLCLFGFTVNMMTIFILNQKSMRSHVNQMLTVISCGNTLILLIYFLHTFYFKLYANFWHANSCPAVHMTEWAAYFSLVYANMTVLIHGTNLWLYTMLAVHRKIILSKNIFYDNSPSFWHTLKICATTYSIITIFCMPIFFTYRIKQEFVPDDEPQCEKLLSKNLDQLAFYVIDLGNFTFIDQNRLIKFDHFINAIVLKCGKKSIIIVNNVVR